MVDFSVQRTIEWKDDSRSIIIIDQSLLPLKLKFVECRSVPELVHAIQTMQIRGAPALGVAGAMGIALSSTTHMKANSKSQLIGLIKKDALSIKNARPTAVNLPWGVEQALGFVHDQLPESVTGKEASEKIIEFVKALADEDVQINRKLSRLGQSLIRTNSTILTHCNAGALATVGYGTALGVIRSAREVGKQVRVFATESRPVMQGARLTSFELKNDGFDVTLIPDTAVGISMQRGLVDCVIVGADRITKDGHVFNKIGTYQVATLAKRHDIPFYVAAPISSFDFRTDWRKVKIEERPPTEVKKIAGIEIAPDVSVFNPAFDATPPELVSAIICEVGVLRKPFGPKIKRLMKLARPRGPVA
ncbi:MAG: S-methyl-5-thioribose-1-phosphate isomerase [Thaumarchaeota archaeon]|nr:S-methyl-5-thioribose-1-phosphate isomerase [Nitrososphaerota archaeon]